MGTLLREFCYVPDTKVGALSEAAACRFVSSACSIRYDTRCCCNVRSKDDISQLNLPRTEPTTEKWKN